MCEEGMVDPDRERREGPEGRRRVEIETQGETHHRRAAESCRVYKILRKYL